MHANTAPASRQACIPDPQHTLLDALLAEVHNLHDDKCISDDTIQWWHDEAPQSHVFAGEDLPQTEEDVETVILVGSRDLNAKIQYWTRRLREYNDRPEDYR